MSSTRKTIKINPELFGLSKKNKTMSKRDKRPKIPSSAMKPNTLRKKLIERVKQHKRKEGGAAPTEASSNPGSSVTDTKVVRDVADLEDKYHEEFRDSIEYLSGIASKYNGMYGNTNAGRNAKRGNNPSKRKKYTKKNNATGGDNREELHVELDLPNELQPVSHNPPLQNDGVPMKLQPSPQYVTDDVPYGCLKGGVKPTYKTWNKTIRHRHELPTAQPSSITDDDAHARLRQEKLTQLKRRMKDRQDLEKTRISTIQTSSHSIPVSQITSNHMVARQEPNSGSHDDTSISVTNTSLPKMELSDTALTSNDTETLSTDIFPTPSAPAIAFEPVSELPLMPKKIKKVTTKTYKLGKNKAKRQYGVLIKNNQTRKRILSAQREIKKAPLADIKTYLRDRGLIKNGSKAPTDILKKMYETSMLSGDITNTDQDVHIHNFIDGHDKET